MTLSGGEPVLQNVFACDLLVHFQAEGIHTALETAGNYHWERLGSLLPHTDLVMMDLKHMDPEQHWVGTGASNERILANARRLAHTDIPLIFRIPVIPGINDNNEAIQAIAHFVLELSDARGATIPLELLPFHRLAESKYTSLGQDYRARKLPDTVKNMIELNAIVNKFGHRDPQDV